MRIAAKFRVVVSLLFVLTLGLPLSAGVLPPGTTTEDWNGGKALTLLQSSRPVSVVAGGESVRPGKFSGAHNWLAALDKPASDFSLNCNSFDASYSDARPDTTLIRLQSGRSPPLATATCF